jgi:nucleoside-diphosphate-sugar epimerase
MRVAVTGASGFVGGRVSRHLIAQGWDVVAFGRQPGDDPTGVPEAEVRYWDIVTGPLTDPPEVDAVVHAAAFVGDVGAREPVRRTNVEGTAAVARTFPRARLVHVSTCSVYHPERPQVMATEDEAPAPETVRWPSPYGETKALAERVLLRRRPDAVVLRPHAVYGPGDTTLMPRLREAGARGTIPLPGSGRQRHSVTQVANLAEACRLACLPDAPPGVYNVTDPEPVPLADAMARLAARPDGTLPRVRPVPAPLLLGVAVVGEGLNRTVRRPRRPPITRYTVGHLGRERTFDITRARTRLGYDPAPTALEHCERW